jgi:hypothetical protein
MMLVRNEDWCLGLSARVALMWCDRLVILLHACTDDSADIVHALDAEYPGRIAIMKVVDPTWNEMQHRQMMLVRARAWDPVDPFLAIVDADEVMTANVVDTIKGSLQRAANHGQMVCLPGYNLRGCDRFHINGLWSDRWFDVAFVDRPGVLGWTGDKFHSRCPDGVNGRWRVIGQGAGGVLHLWGASERRLRAKHRLYRITERIRWSAKPVAQIERMYSMATKGIPPHDTPLNWRFSPIPDGWRYPELEALYLRPDDVPWQEAECDRLLAEHGRQMFVGLDLS